MLRSPLRSAPLLLLTGLLWAAAAGCANSSSHFPDAERHTLQADWFQAWAAIQLAREESPGDPAVEAAYWRIRTGYLLWRAQRMVFGNAERDALAELEKVLTLDPEDPIALAWKQKAIEKLANRTAARGEALRRAGDLDAALQAYHEALLHQPGNQLAEEGLAELGLNWEAHRTAAQQHYLDGLRALAQQFADQAQYHFEMALSLDPTLDVVREPLARVQRQVAQDRLVAARAMIDQGAYEAARYVLEALKKDLPDLDGVDELAAIAERESDAIRLKGEGQLALARGELAVARTAFEKALETSERQAEQIGELLLLLHERELDASYFGAQDLELQGQLEEALVGFEAIAERSPGYRDARARAQDLQVRIDETKLAYDAGLKAEEGGDAEAAIGHYLSVQLFWPTYRDVSERLARLRAARLAPVRN